MFDKERTGGIAVSEMRLILSNLPEKLSDEEIDEMLRTADKGGLISENIFTLVLSSKAWTKSFPSIFQVVQQNPTQCLRWPEKVDPIS